MHPRIRLFGIVVMLFLVRDGAAIASPFQQTTQAYPSAALVVSAGLTMQMATMRPVWARTAKTGDLLYAVTVAPVLVGSQTAIPAGSYVQATIQGIVKPTSKTPQAVVAIRFDKLIFADGYTVDFSTATSSTLATLTIKATAANDLLLDNGTPFVLTLQHDLPLDGQKASQAIPLSHAPALAQFVPATLCRFIPGDPGTPATSDTVIPGSPGTPDVVIPSIDGSPPTVIPGIPATPPTTIPGTPGTPATDPVYCPAPPQVLSSVPGFVLPTPIAKPSGKH